MTITRIEKVEVEVELSNMNETELLQLTKKVLAGEILELGAISASINTRGSPVNLRRFESEMEALLADAYLDDIDDKKRPRNRDEFQEVMTAYLQQMETD